MTDFLKYSIVSDNCWTTVLGKKLQLAYSTPFVNQWIEGENYKKIVKNIRTINLENIHKVAIADLNLTYEVPREMDFAVDIDGIAVIHPIHDDTYEQFAEKWMRRAPRFNKDNMVLKVRFPDKFLPKDLKEIDLTPFKKVLVTNAAEYMEELHEMFPELQKWGNLWWSEKLLVQPHTELGKEDMRAISWSVANYMNN